jgi:hypothetical protein
VRGTVQTWMVEEMERVAAEAAAHNDTSAPTGRTEETIDPPHEASCTPTACDHQLGDADTDVAGPAPTPSQFVIAGLDVKNAYGRAQRSTCLKGTRLYLPSLAPLAAAQWQNQSTAVWQRVHGKWRLTYTARGGWQGSQLMQIMFCVGQ